MRKRGTGGGTKELARPEFPSTALVNVIIPILRAQLPPHGRPDDLASGRLLGNEGFGIARKINLVYTVVHIGCGNEVPHGCPYRLPPHPYLNSSYVSFRQGCVKTVCGS